MLAYWLAGTPPENTSVSVPRLMPECRVRTRTSSGPGSGSRTGRISARPGDRSQRAWASRVTGSSLPKSRPNRTIAFHVLMIRAVHLSHGGAVSTVRAGPLTGLIVQVVLLAGLAGTVGLGRAAWLAGTAYGVVTCAALTRGMRRSGVAELGPADWVTLTRSTLVGGVAALTVGSFDRTAPAAVLATLAVMALVLDGVDGQVARRTGTVTAIGAMRYAFVMATWVLPWMRGSLLPRYWRKVVASTQGVVLVFAVADVLPRPLAAAALAASLALLIESFGRDVGWLWQHRLASPSPAGV